MLDRLDVCSASHMRMDGSHAGAAGAIYRKIRRSSWLVRNEMPLLEFSLNIYMLAYESNVCVDRIEASTLLYRRANEHNFALGTKTPSAHPTKS